MVIDDEIAPDNEATVNSDIVTSEVENESEALAREAETGKTPNTDKMDLQSTDGISSTLKIQNWTKVSRIQRIAVWQRVGQTKM